MEGAISRYREITPFSILRDLDKKRRKARQYRTLIDLSNIYMVSEAKATDLLKAYSALKRARGWTDSRTCASLDIGPGKLLLLEYIAEHDGVSQTELAKATGTDKALTGRSVQEFVDSGWVRREHSSTDGRAYVLSLSPSGYKMVKQFVLLKNQILHRVTLSLSPRDVEDFKRVVAKLIETMKQPLPPLPSRR